jgi:hypothetical protein
MLPSAASPRAEYADTFSVVFDSYLNSVCLPADPNARKLTSSVGSLVCVKHAERTIDVCIQYVLNCDVRPIKTHFFFSFFPTVQDNSSNNSTSSDDSEHDKDKSSSAITVLVVLGVVQSVLLLAALCVIATRLPRRTNTVYPSVRNITPFSPSYEHESDCLHWYRTAGRTRTALQ